MGTMQITQIKGCRRASAVLYSRETHDKNRCNFEINVEELPGVTIVLFLTLFSADCECLPTVREEEKESIANPRYF